MGNFITTNHHYSFMAEIPRVRRIKSTDLALGTKVEKSEHPWASPKVAKQIARDHLSSDDEYYKSGGKECGSRRESVVILNQNVRAQMPRKKKKVEPQPVDTGPTWIPSQYRMYG